jgi:ABC-type Fe3+ transport system substrate-binding protein
MKKKNAQLTRHSARDVVYAHQPALQKQLKQGITQPSKSMLKLRG